MSRSKRDKLQRKAKDYSHGRLELSVSEAMELGRKNAYQYDEMHEGLWAMLRKRYLKMFKRKKADLTFKEQLKEIE